MILVCVIAIVGMMTFLSAFYNKHFFQQNANTNLSLQNHQFTAFDYFTFHMVYVINIMTNQGNNLLLTFTYFLYLIMSRNKRFWHNIVTKSLVTRGL